jgi:uncharacterized protein
VAADRRAVNVAVDTLLRSYPEDVQIRARRYSFAVRKSLAASIFALFLTPVFAQIPGKPAGYVTDSAHVMSIADVRLLNARCSDLDKIHKAQIAIVTVASLRGAPIEQAALDLFNKWGVGRKGIDDGLLLMISVNDRRSRITLGRGLEKTITNTATESILQAMRPDLRLGRYASALGLALDSLEKLLPGAASPR